MSTQHVNLKSTDFQPMNNFVLVETQKLETEKTTTSGLIIPIKPTGTVNNRPTMGKVISVGNDVDWEIRKDDTIFWPKTDGINFDFNDDGVFLLIRDKSIIGKKR